MTVEIMSMLIVAYILIFGQWTAPFFDNTRPLLYFLEWGFPKLIGILVFIYTIGKYVFKIK